MANETPTDPYLNSFRSFISPLSSESHKGQGGKVAVIGGCLEFTGAPFFASMSALRAGADLAYVICTPSAATPLKSFSPELMVLPYLPERTSIFNGGWTPPEGSFISEEEVRGRTEAIVKWIRRANAVVIGPGLGDDPYVNRVVREVIKSLYPAGVPEDPNAPALVIDGSALRHIAAEDPSLFIGIRKCVFTPNLPELKAVGEAVLGRDALAGLLDECRKKKKLAEKRKATGGPETNLINPESKESEAKLGEEMQILGSLILRELRGPTIVAKGTRDFIYALQSPCNDASSSAIASTSRLPPDGESEGVALLKVDGVSGHKRCGGQGDLLAGTIGTFLCWTLRSAPSASSAPARDAADPNGVSVPEMDEISRRVALASYAGSSLVRLAAAAAAKTADGGGERGVVAGDILGKLQATFKAHLEVEP